MGVAHDKGRLYYDFMLTCNDQSGGLVVQLPYLKVGKLLTKCV
jgi:hypothetical protein